VSAVQGKEVSAWGKKRKGGVRGDWALRLGSHCKKKNHKHNGEEGSTPRGKACKARRIGEATIKENACVFLMKERKSK